MTGLRNSLTLLDDETYVPATTKPSDDPYASGAEFPKTKNYRYTALLETDSVLALNGIRTLDDMREYAKRFYPDGKDLPDTDEGSSLYRFVAYHLLPVMLASNQIVSTVDYVVTHTWMDADWLRENYRDGSFWLEQYLVPLAEQSIITVQAFKWGDQDAQKPVFNDERNCYDAQYTNMAEELNHVVTLDMAHSNLDCQNGVIHALTGMLVYDEDKIGRIMRGKRIRMDFTIFTPELRNNDIISRKTIMCRRGIAKNSTLKRAVRCLPNISGRTCTVSFWATIWRFGGCSMLLLPWDPCRPEVMKYVSAIVWMRPRAALRSFI